MHVNRDKGGVRSGPQPILHVPDQTHVVVRWLECGCLDVRKRNMIL